MKAISLGWGVQSWTLAAMVALGELPPVDVAIHSDTTFERAATYTFAAQWAPWLKERDVNVVTVRDPRATNIVKLSGKSGNHYTLMPVFTINDGRNGQLRRQCTSRWKIEPINQWLNTQRGNKPVELWLGISTDEWHRAKDSGVKWVVRKYPLLDLGMSRADCLVWLQRHNLPSPGKSACVQCPYHSKKTWQAMKQENGPDWHDAVKADELLRIDGQQWFLHPGRKPLEEAVVIPEDFGYTQIELLASDDDDAECDSGHCFL